MPGYCASWIMLPSGRSAMLPSPGMQGATGLVLHGGGIFPPPIYQMPLLASQSLMEPCVKWGVGKKSYLNPTSTVRFGRSFQVSSAYKAQLKTDSA